MVVSLEWAAGGDRSAELRYPVACEGIARRYVLRRDVLRWNLGRIWRYREVLPGTTAPARHGHTHIGSRDCPGHSGYRAQPLHLLRAYRGILLTDVLVLSVHRS